jgi:ankyrin repeat protein
MQLYNYTKGCNHKCIGGELLMKKYILIVLALIVFPASRILADDEYNSCQTPLYKAARKGDAAELKRLLASGVPVNVKNGDCSRWVFRNEIPLFAAIESEKIDAVRTLVENGADVKSTSEYKGSVMHAAMSSTPEIIAYLASKGADPNVYYSYKVSADRYMINGTPLHEATESLLEYTNREGSGSPQYKSLFFRLEALVLAGSDVNISRRNNGYSVLHMAAAAGDRSLVEFFVKHGAMVDQTSLRGETPYCLAIRYNHDAIGDYLLSFGADKKAKCVSDLRRENLNDALDSTGLFFKYMIIPLTYLGLSVYLYENRFKNDLSKNRLGTFNAYTLTVSASIVSFGLLGFFLYPADSGFLGGLSKIIGMMIGGAVGIPAGIYIAKHYNFPHRFKTNRGLYYAAPVLASGITLFAFTQQF